MKKSESRPDWVYDLATATQNLQVEGQSHRLGQCVDFSDPIAVRDHICRNHPFGDLLCFEGIVKACAEGHGETLLRAMSPNYLMQFDNLTSLQPSGEREPTRLRMAEHVDSKCNDVGAGYRNWAALTKTDPIEDVINGIIAEKDENIDWIDDECTDEGMENIRLRFAEMEVDDLVIEFISGEWWDCIELHDELRRACSGSSDYSQYLARRVGFEFLTGKIYGHACLGNGPLSTPLQFTSVYPEAPSWNEEPTVLCEVTRRDAVKLSHCLSFMMH